MPHERLQHRELAGRQRDRLAALRQPAQREIELERSEADDLDLLGRRAGGLGRRAAPQHRVDPREQLARVERLGQIVVGADLEADDAVDILDLRSQHDDRRRIVGGAQAPADRQPVLAGQHQVEHDEVDRLASQHPVQRLRVLGEEHLEALLRQVAPQQVADAGVVVDDDNAVRARRGRGVHP
jgi:hypothetical protein